MCLSVCARSFIQLHAAVAIGNWVRAFKLADTMGLLQQIDFDPLLAVRFVPATLYRFSFADIDVVYYCCLVVACRAYLSNFETPRFRRLNRHTRSVIACFGKRCDLIRRLQANRLFGANA